MSCIRNCLLSCHLTNFTPGTPFIAVLERSISWARPWARRLIPRTSTLTASSTRRTRWMTRLPSTELVWTASARRVRGGYWSGVEYFMVGAFSMHQVLRLGSTQYNIWIPVHSLLHVYTTMSGLCSRYMYVAYLGTLSIYRLRM